MEDSVMRSFLFLMIGVVTLAGCNRATSTAARSSSDARAVAIVRIDSRFDQVVPKDALLENGKPNQN
jgi:hypothetical protein